MIPQLFCLNHLVKVNPGYMIEGCIPVHKMCVSLGQKFH